MNFFDKAGRSFDTVVGGSDTGDVGFSPESLEKYDKIMEEDGCDDAGIKAEEMSELTFEECEEKYNELMENSEPKKYYDDNDCLFRIGIDLLPNNKYEINGYTYITDELGRIRRVTGILYLKTREGRLPIRDSIEDIGKGDQREGDDRGHLIGDQFDGSNGLENMIPQDANINRTDFKNFENELAKEVKNGKEVKVEVELEYEGDSRRPSEIVVTYSIDGEESVRIFPNGRKE